jgi:hypothetical protein
VNNTCYIFGGQGHDDRLYNDLYTLSFDINESEKRFNAVWAIEETHGVKPPARTSHSSTAYKSHFLIIIGGEGMDESKLIY